MFISFKKLPTVTYTCMDFNKQLPMDNANEYGLNYANCVSY